MPNNIRFQPSWVSTGNPRTVSDETPYAPGQIGARLTIKAPGPQGVPAAEQYREHTYQYVQTDSTMAVAPFDGAVAWWADKTVYRVTTDPAALGRGRIAGIFCRAWDNAGDYMWIQTEGPKTVKFIDAVAAAPTAAGLFVIPSATAAKADTLAAGTAATYPTLGVTAGAYDAPNAEAVVDLDVQDTP